MGIETPADLEGSECSFTSAIIAVEELARVDPSIAVMCDVHNTLVNTVLRLYGSEAIQKKWLPDLATKKVCHKLAVRAYQSGWKFLPIGAECWVRCIRSADYCKAKWGSLYIERKQIVSHPWVYES
jgi:hypothetical protein